MINMLFERFVFQVAIPYKNSFFLNEGVMITRAYENDLNGILELYRHLFPVLGSSFQAGRMY